VHHPLAVDWPVRLAAVGDQEHLVVSSSEEAVLQDDGLRLGIAIDSADIPYLRAYPKGAAVLFLVVIYRLKETQGIRLRFHRATSLRDYATRRRQTI